MAPVQLVTVEAQPQAAQLEPTWWKRHGNTVNSALFTLGWIAAMAASGWVFGNMSKLNAIHPSVGGSLLGVGLAVYLCTALGIGVFIAYGGCRVPEEYD